MKLNDKIEVVYNNVEYICEITSIDKNVLCKIVSVLEKKERSANIENKCAN